MFATIPTFEAGMMLRFMAFPLTGQAILCALCLVFLLLKTNAVHAYDAELDLADADFQHSDLLQQHIVVWENSAQELEALDIWRSFDQWRLSKAFHPDAMPIDWIPFQQFPRRNYAVTVIWAAVHLRNNSDVSMPLVFENDNVTVRDISVFIVREGDIAQQVSFGKNYSYADRLIDHRFFRWPITLAPHEEVDLLMRVRVSGVSHIAINASHIKPLTDYLYDNASHERLIWLYFGMMLLIAIMSGVIAYETRSISFVYFSLFVLSVLFLHFVRDGYALRYLWPNWAWMRNSDILLAGTLMFIAILQFSKDFLDLRRYHPRVKQLIDGVCILFVGMLIISLLLPVQYAYLLLIIMAMIVIPMLLCLLYFSISLWRSGNEMAKAYTVAWGLYVVSLSLSFITSYYLPLEFHLGDWPSNIALFVLSVMIFMVLIKRMRSSQIERDRALAESAAKSDFLAKMSHEIRTPMNGVLGMAELLQDTKLDETQSYYTRVIFNSGRTLLNVINEILDYSKISAGKVELEHIDFDIFHLGQECVSLFTAQAREKHLELICRIDPQLPRHFVGDEGRIRQIIINLLGNAFKFTEAGEVMLNIEPSDGQIRFQIQDTGIGITAEQQQKLFQDFTQADVSTSRKYGGTGLGLTISKQLVELMQGEIFIDSEYGLGTTFSFDLPLQPAEGELPALQGDASLQGMRLLLVEDNESYKRVASELLGLLGMQVICADNGEHALKVLDELEGRGETLDLISTDMDMPIMDGMALIERLSQRQHRYPVILLSASGFLPSREEYEQYDVLAAVQKPILAEELKQLFQRVLGKQQRQAASEEKTDEVEEPATQTSLNLLVAEDNEVNFQVAASMLRKLGHRVIHATDGFEAVTKFKAHNLNAREMAFDAIFMDCEMPNMDGFEATEAIRKLEAQRHLTAITIVALTAHSDEQRIAQCYSCGMNSYLGKPILIKDFKQQLEGLCASD